MNQPAFISAEILALGTLYIRIALTELDHYLKPRASFSQSMFEVKPKAPALPPASNTSVALVKPYLATISTIEVNKYVLIHTSELTFDDSFENQMASKVQSEGQGGVLRLRASPQVTAAVRNVHARPVPEALK